jgi:predicted transcriptional regulator of viral defense system
MDFKKLLQLTGGLSCFTTRFLAAGEDLAQIRLQLARWVKDGRVVKLHKGLYAIAQPYRKITPATFCIANALKLPSYISLQSALSWHGLIPEFVPVVTSVTTARPQTIATSVGRFEFRHIQVDLFWGFQKIELADKQDAFVATPEKALLDLVHLTAGGDKEEFLEELRLQNLSRLSKDVLRQYAEKSESPKLKRAVSNIESILNRGEGVEL